MYIWQPKNGEKC